ncbi:MAG TPA: acetolactate synthase large subunit [Polaromonas sp.]|uniref:thiamine pyrophosphate-binding protein n=1 Tax=Polaromonas sp. UBA4122 TaxID=1947074 RepID=UPI000EDAECA0|nr:thiamine pyrophosphate-binding protein [Polaromonas sp. UBA4122]HAL39489.1 acetolactate synthase large subunit [Polaromonas sp.]
MKKTGAWLATYALEQIGARFTFGIPGVHTTELYDELNNSQKITPVLVTHEGGGAFMADAVSRLSDSIGVLTVVPAAGLTHASSGIGEAFLDGVPMLVICGGPRSDSDYRFQLHQMDMHKFMSGLTKATFKVTSHEQVVPTLFEAYAIATGGEPGPVFIELPVNILLYTGEVSDLPRYAAPLPEPFGFEQEILRAAELLRHAKHPCLFVGWGTRNAFDQFKAVAEWLEAPVATTLQGLSAFPGNHPLHVGFGFGASAVPAARNAFKDCDCLLAVGTRFSEIATGSYGVDVPENLIHIDINPETIGANYPAKVGIPGDAALVSNQLLKALQASGPRRAVQSALRAQIRSDKEAYRQSWYKSDVPDRVNPARFFDQLRLQTPDDGIIVVDDGNHTFLTAELMPIHAPRSVILPTDFNCMGYAVPAAIGAKLSHPGRLVQTIVGDGAFLMTCMEILTATSNHLGVIYYVFHDGELSQIAQAQEIPYNRKPCTKLGPVNLEGVALATGAAFVRMPDNDSIDGAIRQAIEISCSGRPVIVDVKIDYSKRTAFTEGAVKTNFQRFPLNQKVRTLTRAFTRRVTG